MVDEYVKGWCYVYFNISLFFIYSLIVGIILYILLFYLYFIIIMYIFIFMKNMFCGYLFMLF